MHGTGRNLHEIPGQTAGDFPRHFNLELSFSNDNELVGVVDKFRPDLSRRITEDAEGKAGMISPYRVARDGNGIRTVLKEFVHPRFPSERQSPGPAAADHRRSRLTSLWHFRLLDPAGIMTVLAVTLPETRAHDGCTSVETLRNSDDPDQVVAEVRESREQYEKCLAWQRDRGTSARLIGCLAESPSIRHFNLTDA